MHFTGHILFDKIAVTLKQNLPPRSFRDYDIKLDPGMPDGVELIEKL